MAKGILKEFVNGMSNRFLVNKDSGNGEFHSISRFDRPKVGLVRIPVPSIVCTKGCDHGGKPSKSYQVSIDQGYHMLKQNKCKFT